MRRKRRRHGKSRTHRALAKRYGHSFADGVKSVGSKIRELARKHPGATAALTGAGVGSVTGGMSTGAGALLGATAGLVAEEVSKK